MMEIWAALFMLGALMCLVRGWRVASLVLLLAAVASREFMVLLIPVWLVAWWFGDSRRGRHADRRRTWWFPAIATVGPAVILLLHVIFAPTMPGDRGSIARWLHGGLQALYAAARFGWDVAPFPKVVTILMPVLALICALTVRPRGLAIALTTAVVLPLGFLTAFSTGNWGDYWDLCFIPVFIALAPLAVHRLTPPMAQTAGRSGGSWR